MGGHHVSCPDVLGVELSSRADSANALIYGEFDNDILRLNASVQVRDVLKIEDVLQLQPRTSEPSGGEAGMIYFNSTDSKLYIHDGSEWRSVTLDPP